MIGDSVTVTILGVKGNQVRVGINAPKDVAVHREEIFQKIGKEGGARGDDGARRFRFTGDRLSGYPTRPGRMTAARRNVAGAVEPERCPRGRRGSPAKGV